jgi:hypothetical protein
MPNGEFERMISDIWGPIVTEIRHVTHGNPIVFGQEDFGEIGSRLFYVARGSGRVARPSRPNNPSVLPMVIATLQRLEVTATRRHARLRGEAP